MYSWLANDYVIIDRCFEKAFLETLAPCLRRATCANDATRAFAICRNSPRASHCAHMKLAGSATSGNDVTSSSRRGRREGDEEEVEDGGKKKKKKLHHLHLYTTSQTPTFSLLPPPNLPLPSSPTTSPYLPDLTSPSAYPPLLSPTIVTVLTPIDSTHSCTTSSHRFTNFLPISLELLFLQATRASHHLQAAAPDTLIQHAKSETQATTRLRSSGHTFVSPPHWRQHNVLTSSRSSFSSQPTLLSRRLPAHPRGPHR